MAMPTPNFSADMPALAAIDIAATRDLLLAMIPLAGVALAMLTARLTVIRTLGRML